MALSSQLTRFNAPGVKLITEVVENTPSAQAPRGARVLIINSRKGPVNTHVLVSNFTEYSRLFDGISDADERRGNWGARSAEYMLSESPIYVINLRRFDNTLDLAGFNELSTVGDVANAAGKTVPYSSLYATSQFWKVEPAQLIKSTNTENLLVLGNIGASSLSVFVRKTRNNVKSLTFQQWYANLNREMPSYVNPFDKVGDWMVDVVVFNNKFDAASKNNANYGYVFDIDGHVKSSVVNQSNIAVDGLTQLTTIPESGYMTTISGSLVQNFTDEFGNNLDVVALINQRVQEIGLIAKINDAIFDDAGIWLPGASANSNGQKKLIPVDFSGHSLCNTTATGTFDKTAYLANANVNTLSYAFATAAQTIAVTTTTLDSLVAIDDASSLVEHTALLPGSIAGANVVVGVLNELYVAGSLKSSLGEKYAAFDGTLASVTKITHQGLVNDVDVYKLTFDKNLAINALAGQAIAVDLAPILVDGAETITFDDASSIVVYAGAFYVYKVKTFEQMSTKFVPVNLTSYTPRTAQFLDGTAVRQTNILDVLIDTGLRDALSNHDLITFNYIVDGFKSFIEPNCKYQLRQIAEDRILARAICNMPSIYDFQHSTNPYFTDAIDGKFLPRLIVEGGNTELPYTNTFSLPSVNGFYSYHFGPNILLSNGKSMPPAAIVSNNFALKYRNNKQYAIVAGPTDGAIVGKNIAGVEYVFNEKNDGTGDRDYLDPFGYNVILKKRSTGLQIYGNRTAQNTVETALSSIHSSEILMYIQERVKSLLERFVFKYNTSQNRLVIKEEADSICNEPLGDGAISGYVNVMNETNNTTEVIKNRIGILDTTIYANNGLEILVHRTKIDTVTNEVTFEIL